MVPRPVSRMNSAQISREHGGDKPKAREVNSSAPPYGSRTYWEQRYASHRRLKRDDRPSKRHKANNFDSDPAVCEKNKGGEEDTEPLPGHAWYFTYEELRPIILSVILGKGDEAIHYGIEVKCKSSKDGDKNKEIEDSRGSNAEYSSGGPQERAYASQEGAIIGDKCITKNDQRLMSNETSMTTEANAGPAELPDTQKRESFPTESSNQLLDKPRKGPKSILEIGCGDVPLGADLFKELVQLQCATGSRADFVVHRIVCCDFSETVIQTMNESKPSLFEDLGVHGACFLPSTLEHAKPTTASAEGGGNHKANSSGCPELVFEVADARDMVYSDGEFDLILEKGTLDAMLSDKAIGISNCIQIVKESARVLAIDGYMMVVSHLNAHTTSGLEWLDEVVIPGLCTGGGGATWEIEVHGGDVRENVHSDEEWEEDVGVLLGDRETGEADDGAAGGGYSSDSHNDNITNNPEGSNSADDENEIESLLNQAESLGPAVYVIHKMHPKQVQSDTKNPNQDVTNKEPTIPLKFLSYQRGSM